MGRKANKPYVYTVSELSGTHNKGIAEPERQKPRSVPIEFGTPRLLHKEFYLVFVHG